MTRTDTDTDRLTEEHTNITVLLIYPHTLTWGLNSHIHKKKQTNDIIIHIHTDTHKSRESRSQADTQGFKKQNYES